MNRDVTLNREVTLEQFRRWLILYAQLIAQAEARLTELDSAIGDGDHGINMQRGMTRVHARMVALDPAGDSVTRESGEPIADIGALLRHAAMTLISSVGGAAGPLYGAFFLWAAKRVGPQQSVDLQQLAELMRSGLDGVQQRGKAQPGEKTMIDTLAPAIAALETACEQELSLGAALDEAVSAAEQGMESTIAMQARKGRASYLGQRSVGHLDPGAASAFLLMRAAAACFGASVPGAALSRAGGDTAADAAATPNTAGQESAASAESVESVESGESVESMVRAIRQTS